MIAIIKYNAGNTQSVENAVQRLGYDCIVTDNPQEIELAEKVIFPGVGEASGAMKSLSKTCLDILIPTLQQPVLGICLGLQLMCKSSEEGNTKGMGIFNVAVKKFPPLDRIPQMGWNTLYKTRGKLFNGIQPQDDVYFVHSYYAGISEDTIAQCDYILPFSAALQKDNFYAVQFHIEKSGVVGEHLLKNFLAL